MFENTKIDNPIKIFMMEDTYGIFGMYFIVFEKRGKEDFIIGSCYPVVITGDNQIHMMSYYPISPDRIIVLVSSGVEYASQDNLDFDKRDIKKPKNPYRISVKRVYDDRIKYINSLFLKHSEEGIAFRDIENISFLRKNN